MTHPAPETPPAEGFLAVGDGQQIYWWTAGNPRGKALLVVHGGPGSGSSPASARFADPQAYRIIGFDQRGCGRSTPDAADPATDLSVNTTQHLIADMEALREHLRVEKWVVIGGSWGSNLSLAYAEQYPERVHGLVLFAVVTTSAREVAWVTEAMCRVFPEQWARFREAVPENLRHEKPVDAYATLLASDDPVVRAQAAAAWCAWEDTHVSLGGNGHDPRYDDAVFAYRFARLVTHYWRHSGFLPEGQLMAGVARLADVPATLIAGRLDVSGPPDTAWHLAQRWPAAEFVICEAGHGGGAMPEAIRRATDALAQQI